VLTQRSTAIVPRMPIVILNETLVAGTILTRTGSEEMTNCCESTSSARRMRVLVSKFHRSFVFRRFARYSVPWGRISLTASSAYGKLYLCPRLIPRPSRFERSRCQLNSAKRSLPLPSDTRSQPCNPRPSRVRAAVAQRRRSILPLARRRWSIVNLSIIVLNKCKALMNVCAMVRPVSL
jgi:hypothetical protein